MKSFKSLIIFVLTVVFLNFLFSSCNQQLELQTAPSGYRYVFFESHPEAQQTKIGDILILDMKYYLNNDSLLFSTQDFTNEYKMKLKKVIAQEGTIDDALATMHVGDSACFVVNANLFYSITKKQRVPMFVTQTDEIYFYIKLKNITDVYSYFKKKNRALKNDSKSELDQLKHFLKTANITEKPSSSGLYKVEEHQGKGQKARLGSLISLHYNGYFVNGESFSNTFNSKPFEVKLGNSELILGFEEGLVGVQKGGQYKLVIPSHLAYGSEGNQVIPPFRTLIFDITVLDVK